MTAISGFGDEEGAVCGRNGCKGIIELRPHKGCYCHISPPCGACTTPREHCPDCGWSAEEEERSFYINGFRCVAESKDDAELGPYSSRPLLDWKPRPLDPTKIDWHTRSHTHSSMICEGVYPPGTTSDEVRARVDGTFGGRFEEFGNGRFKFIAYTD